ncbi:MAG: methylated-DNA--[protein]-cysteine S-methyltransferase [Gemmatimonadota bacterium]|nr:methylated-DNA--[protein]-cysteine S-methyltransferase [Gemmatimonadota bacterium]MDE3173756.1 methylated-DNA--[protein]-cysteine S-methyltransferase [Gemmatimonadota bacterium]MDE3216951.1 methylated-DNA--[protein]-cysteine S-methyltransferase [Gemmatimonadota bacterium]
MRYLTMPSPLGTLTLGASDDGLAAVYFERHKHGPSDGERRAWQLDHGGANPASRTLATAREQLAAYFAGQRREFDLPLAPGGTPFQQRVWAELRKIPYGGTASYGELARRLGAPTASRAVGTANGRNPLSIVVPCHRVIGANGSLVGYGGGLERKRWLLNFEGGSATLFPE